MRWFGCVRGKEGGVKYKDTKKLLQLKRYSVCILLFISPQTLDSNSWKISLCGTNSHSGVFNIPSVATRMLKCELIPIPHVPHEEGGHGGTLGANWGQTLSLESGFVGWMGRRRGRMLSRGPGWDADDGKTPAAQTLLCSSVGQRQGRRAWHCLQQNKTDKNSKRATRHLKSIPTALCQST